MGGDPHATGTRVRAWAVLVFGLVCVSSAAIFVRLAGVEATPLAIATWRLVFASAILTPTTLLARRRALRRVDAEDGRVIVLAGLALAVHFGLWITSLRLTSVASSVVLVTTSPLWVALIEPRLFHQRYRWGLLAGVGVAFAGGVIIVTGDRGGPASAPVGDVLAIGGAIAAAAYFLAGRRVRGHLDLVVYVALVYGVAALALLATSLVLGVHLAPFSPQVWLYLVLLAVVPQVLGHSSFNWALGHLSATYVSATVLGEALGSTLLAWWVLGEPPPATTLAGGALILLGLWQASRVEARSGATAPS